MIEPKHVSGKKLADIFIYTLSTCGWCKKTKAFLNELGLDYNYIDVDLLPENEEDAVVEELKKWNPSCSFPTMVINKEHCIVGFQPDKIKEKVGL